MITSKITSQQRPPLQTCFHIKLLMARNTDCLHDLALDQMSWVQVDLCLAVWWNNISYLNKTLSIPATLSGKYSKSCGRKERGYTDSTLVTTERLQDLQVQIKMQYCICGQTDWGTDEWTNALADLPTVPHQDLWGSHFSNDDHHLRI